MLPTPSTSHVNYDAVYEPAEDSFLVLDTLSSPAEMAWLTSRFAGRSSPLVVEVGTGSGVVLSFLTAHARHIFGRPDVLTLGTDVNGLACSAAVETVRTAVKGAPSVTHGTTLAVLTTDLCSGLRAGMVDVLVFNPPYVPTETVPAIPTGLVSGEVPDLDVENDMLSLSYAGGPLGMVTTQRLLDSLPDVLSARGVAYVLLCAQNKPKEVMDSIRTTHGTGWGVAVVGDLGGKGGWERLCIVRIWRV